MTEGGYIAFMDTIIKNIIIDIITLNKYFHISDTSFLLLETAYGDDNRPSIFSYLLRIIIYRLSNKVKLK